MQPWLTPQGLFESLTPRCFRREPRYYSMRRDERDERYEYSYGRPEFARVVTPDNYSGDFGYSASFERGDSYSRPFSPPRRAGPGFSHRSGPDISSGRKVVEIRPRSGGFAREYGPTNGGPFRPPPDRGESFSRPDIMEAVPRNSAYYPDSPPLASGGFGPSYRRGRGRPDIVQTGRRRGEREVPLSRCPRYLPFMTRF